MAPRKQYTEKELELKKMVDEITDELDRMQNLVLQQASSLLGRNVTLQSLHGKIGGKNNTYLNLVYEQFPAPQNYIAKWLKGLSEQYQLYLHYGSNSSTFEMITLVKDPLVRDYIIKFLTRNFYKNYEARVRTKPDAPLWQIWFGNTPVHGLFIAPVLCLDGSWRTDRSEIRRVSYQYWTVGHVLAVGGFIDDSNYKYQINSINDFFNYYLGIVKAVAKSTYEKEIADRYVLYLKQSRNIYSEPFLIPEFRYGGKDKNHKYRLDFTILNPYTNRFVGFELSPASTHMNISGLGGTKLTQTAVNVQLAQQWGNQTSKCREYYSTYGIHVETFTDEQLTKNIDGCFSEMEKYLSERNTLYPSLESMLNQIDTLPLQ